MPPLRARKTDILLLADFFLEKYARKTTKTLNAFPRRPLTCPWNTTGRGNVRELETASNGRCCCARKALFTAIIGRRPFKPERNPTPCPPCPWKMPSPAWRKNDHRCPQKHRGQCPHGHPDTTDHVRKFAYKAQRYGVDYRQCR